MPGKIIWIVLLAAFLTACTKSTAEADKNGHNNEGDAVEMVFKEEKSAAIAGFNGFYLLHPSEIEKLQKSIPLLIYLHGLGQRGDGNKDLYLLGEDGLGKLMKSGELPSAFKVKEEWLSFVVIAPQWSEFPDAAAILATIQYASQKYNIDQSRVYLAGISAGGMAISKALPEISGKIAAFIAIAGVADDSNGKIAQAIASANLPIWLLHNNRDTMVNSGYSKHLVEAVNSLQPPVKARLTLFENESHDAWTKVLNPDFNENGQNIYEWMLQY